MNKSSSSSQSEFENWAKQNISPEQQAALSNLWGKANSMYEQNAQGSQQFQGDLTGRMARAGEDAIANQKQNYQYGNDLIQDQYRGGVYRGMDNSGQLASSLKQSLNTPSNMQNINSMIMGGEGNNYADAMKGQYMQDANRAQEQMMGNMDARAAASGMSGGSRHGAATAQGMQDINSNLQSNMAQTGFNTFDKDLDRKLNIAQQADQGTLARQGMLQGMLGQEQQMQQQQFGNLNQQNQNAQNPYNMQRQFGQDATNNMNQGQQQLDWLSRLIGPQQVLDSSGGTGSSSGSGKSFGMGGSGGIK